MGNYYVLGLQEREQWLRELENIKHINPDLHYRPEYCELFRDQGEARLFIYREGAATIIYPFLLRKVNQIPGLEDKLTQNLYDITSFYGYGGPLANLLSSKEIWGNFYRSFSEYCASNDIITEFIRFHPILANHRILEDYVNVERVSSVVCIDLKQTDEQIWSGYERNNRKNIKKAYREGLTVLLEGTTTNFSDFISIYYHTLSRNQAQDAYYYNHRFFDLLHKELNKNFLYAYTLKDGRIISTELLLYNESYIHSFLGGTLQQFYEYRPNNILKHEVIKWAKKRGIKFFILGGGYRDGDGIFRYKRSFSTRGIFDYYVGKKIHKREAVDKLEEMIKLKKNRVSEGIFPGYRNRRD